MDRLEALADGRLRYRFKRPMVKNLVHVKKPWRSERMISAHSIF
jgi:hypothetical protein